MYDVHHTGRHQDQVSETIGTGTTEIMGTRGRARSEDWTGMRGIRRA